jgi:hypothetical protein
MEAAGLFSVDSFAGGLIINALLALWLFERFQLLLTAAGAFFFWTGLLSAVSQLAAAPLAMATPLVLCGVLKSVYDVALLVMFRKVPPQD